MMLWSSQSPAEPDLFSTRLNNGKMPGQSEVMQQAAPMLPGSTWTAAGGGLAASPSIRRVKGQWGDVYVCGVCVICQQSIYMTYFCSSVTSWEDATAWRRFDYKQQHASCPCEGRELLAGVRCDCFNLCVVQEGWRLDWKVHLLWVFVQNRINVLAE